MARDLVQISNGYGAVAELDAHQRAFRRKYLIPSPERAPERTKMYGRYDTDFMWTLIDFCRDGGISTDMSNYLKGRSAEFPNPPDSWTIHIANKANTLNALVHQAPPSPIRLTLFRAVDVPRTGPPFFPFDETATRFVEFLRHGMLSTSYSKQAAIDFLDDNNPCCFCILLCPVGTKCLYVDGMSAWDAEREVLLPSGNLFRLRHSYNETVTKSNGARFKVRILVCELEGQYLPDDRAQRRIVPNSLLHRRPYKGKRVQPPRHKAYIQPPPAAASYTDFIDLTDEGAESLSASPSAKPSSPSQNPAAPEAESQFTPENASRTAGSSKTTVAAQKKRRP